MKNDEQLQKKDLPIWFEGITFATACRPSVIRTRDHDDYQDDDARPEGEISAKRYKTFEYGTYSVGESSSGQAMDQDRNPSGTGTQEQLDEFDAWMEDAGTDDDDEVPDDKISQELVDEMSEEIDEDQMQNYLKNDIVWESRKERLTLPTPKKKAQVVFSCQRDPKAPSLTLINQDLFYLKHEKLGPKKYTLSLHKFHVVLFPDDDMEERTSRRANGKIDPITELDYKYLNKNDIKDMYLLCINDKVKDYREIGLLGSLVVFIRATVIWERVYDFQLGMKSYQQKVNLTAPTITFSGIEEYKLFNTVSKPICGMIYENNKKEKRVMVHKEP
ncbi:hypothetical protein Tco_1440056 [Tanacetum coccineum]